MPTPLAPQPKRALVVGASSGIGAACAAELVKRGYRVALVARRGDLLDQLAAKLNQKAGMEAALPFPHDVTAYDEIPALFDHIAAALGGLSVIIYAAGVMYPIGREEYDFGKDRAMVEVNLLGAVAWLNQAADLFRRIGGGTIIGISSIAGERGRKPGPVYGTTKAALNHYLESLRNRLAASGVRVITIKPGYVDTEMVRGVKNPIFLISPEEAARRIVNAAERGPEVLFVPRRWGLIGWVLRILPSPLFKRLNV